MIQNNASDIADASFYVTIATGTTTAAAKAAQSADFIDWVTDHTLLISLGFTGASASVMIFAKLVDIFFKIYDRIKDRKNASSENQ